MPGVIGMGNHPKLLWPGVKALWGVGYGEHPEEFRDLFETATSEQAWEEDVMVSGFPLAPVVQDGAPIAYASHAQGPISRYTHVAYALGFIVTFQERINNLYAKLASSRSKSLGFSFRQTKETVSANVLNRAFNTSYLGGDGVVLCATTHPSGAGNQSNLLSPAADLSEVAIEDLNIQIMKALNHDGLKIGLKPMSLHLPPDLWYEANRILKSEHQNDTANNAINAIRLSGDFPGGIKVNHYFTDADAWFARTNCPDAMKHYQRYRIELEQDNDFDTKNAKASSYDYYSFGWSDWRGVYGSSGA